MVGRAGQRSGLHTTQAPPNPKTKEQRLEKKTATEVQFSQEAYVGSPGKAETLRIIKPHCFHVYPTKTMALYSSIPFILKTKSRATIGIRNLGRMMEGAKERRKTPNEQQTDRCPTLSSRAPFIPNRNITT